MNRIVITAISIIIIALVVGLVFMFTRNDVPIEPFDIDNDDEVVEHNDMIRLFSPRPNQVVTSPLYVEGEARGTWFFEADFPVTILDEDGNVLLSYFIMTLHDWMTERYVPFEAHLEFDAPLTGAGTLILHKDNPSGLPEFDDEVRIPIRFGN